MAALPPQSGIARELETEAEREKGRRSWSSHFFVATFVFVSFLLCAHCSRFLLCSVFSSARLAILLLYFCRFCFASVNFYAVWQCLNDIHIRSVCQCLPLFLLIRPGYCTCFPELLELNHQSELSWYRYSNSVGVQWSLCYTVHPLSFPLWRYFLLGSTVLHS